VYAKELQAIEIYLDGPVGFFYRLKKGYEPGLIEQPKFPGQSVREKMNSQIAIFKV